MIDINLEKDLLKLVDIGLRGNFDELADLSDFQDHRSVCRLTDRHRHSVMYFASKLSGNDRIAFIKSIAMLEHKVGGMGSVTLLQRLLPLNSFSDRNLLDWILCNTESYSYYARGARSIEQLDSENAWRATLTARRVAKDMQRQLEDKKRIAEKATHNLYNAVRRGDIKAVRSLVSKGANTTAPSPDGRTMIDFASSLGHTAIAAELHALAKLQAPPMDGIETLTEYEAIVVFAEAWNSLDPGKLIDLMADDVYYTSQRVLEELATKEAVSAFLQERMRRTAESVTSKPNVKVFAELGRTKASPESNCVILAQGTHENIVAIVFLKVEGNRIKRINLCVPQFVQVIRSGVYPERGG